MSATTRRVFTRLGVKPGHGHGGKEFGKLLATRPAAAPKHQGRSLAPAKSKSSQQMVPLLINESYFVLPEQIIEHFCVITL